MKELATAVAAPSHCCQAVIITSHARATIFYLYGLAGLRAPLGGKSKSGKNSQTPLRVARTTGSHGVHAFGELCPGQRRKRFFVDQRTKVHTETALFCEPSVLEDRRFTKKKRGLRVNFCPLGHKKALPAMAGAKFTKSVNSV